jgi:hypothetical protein
MSLILAGVCAKIGDCDFNTDCGRIDKWLNKRSKELAVRKKEYLGFGYGCGLEMAVQ